jgi:RNA polymerase sigma-70 factor (ECF subfamily)
MIAMPDSNPEHRHDDPVADAPERSNVADLVAGCQVGSREAQRSLYDLFHASTYRVVARMVGEHEAADVVQDVFLQVYDKVSQFAGRASFATWLYRLTVNAALQHLRKTRRQRHASLDNDPEDLRAAKDQTSDQQEMLQAALLRIDPQLRAIFLLRELEDQSYRDIAHVLQIPEGTVGSRLNRARRELREQLIALGWET